MLHPSIPKAVGSGRSGAIRRWTRTLLATVLIASLTTPALAQRPDRGERGPDRADDQRDGPREERHDNRGQRGDGQRGDGQRGDERRAERAQQEQQRRAEQEQQRNAQEQQRRAAQADQQQRAENQRRAEQVDRERRADDGRRAERQQRADESRRAEGQRQAERADQQRRAEQQRHADQGRRDDQQRREARDRDGSRDWSRDRDRDRERFQRYRDQARFDRRDWRPRGGWNRDRNFVVYRGRPVIVRPERRRVYRDIVVLRPYGHYYTGYGRYYRDDDAWRFLGLTAITFALLDAMNEAQQRALEDAQIRATEAPIGEPIYWEDGNAEGLVVTTREGHTEDGRYCREFQQEVTIGGRQEEAYGTACQQPDGSWQVVED